MAAEQAIRDGSQVTGLLVTNASSVTDTLKVYGDAASHAAYVYIAGSATGGSSVNIAQVNGQTVSVGLGTSGSTGTQRVAVASDSSINTTTVTTATLTNVNDAASNTQLSALNTARKGWFCYNDSTAALNINFGATASATAFTVRLSAAQYYEMPLPIFTGVINGIWDSDQSGAARITELSA